MKNHTVEISREQLGLKCSNGLETLILVYLFFLKFIRRESIKIVETSSSSNISVSHNKCY